MKALYERWRRGDFKTDEGLFGPDFEWRQSEYAVEPGTRRGREGAARMARGVFEVFEGFRIVPVEFIDAGERVVVVSRIHGRARATGIEFEQPYVQVWEFRGGEPVSVADYRDRGQALEAVGLAR